jgi:hypothetical protein
LEICCRFSGVAFQSYSTRMQAEEAYVAFLDHQNELWKLEQVAQKEGDVTKEWSWKDVVGFSGAAFQSYSTRMQTEEAYVAFLDHQNKLQKLDQVTQKAGDVAKEWSCKDWVILVQFVVIVVLWYNIM